MIELVPYDNKYKADFKQLNIVWLDKYGLTESHDLEVLDDPENFKTKEESKLSVLEHILQPEVYPSLYEGFSHVVRINYYPQRDE